jgi:hypothetical protein
VLFWLFIKIFFFQIVLRASECEENYSELNKNGKIFRITNTPHRLKDIPAFGAGFCYKPCATPHSPKLSMGGYLGFLEYLFSGLKKI